MARGLLIDGGENEDERMISRAIAAAAAHVKGAHSAPPAVNASDDPSSGTNFAQILFNNGLSTTNFIALHQGNDLGNLSLDNQAQGRSKNKDAGTNPAAPAQAAAAPPAATQTNAPPAGQTAADASISPAQAAAAALAAQSASGDAVPTNVTPAAGTNPQLVATPGVDPTQAATQNATAANATPTPPGAAELNARIVAGTPNFLSQSSAILGGLWHHAGDAAKSAAQSANSDPDADSGTAPADTGNPDATQTHNGTSAKTAAANDAALASLHDALDSSVSAGANEPLASAPAPTSSPDAQPGAQPLPGTPLQSSATPLSPVSPNPVVPAAMTIMPPVDQVAFSLKQAVQNGTDRIEIQLKPASLGAINVKLDLSHDGKISAVISADRSDTLNMLRQDADQLQQALRDAGLQTDSNSLSFNLRNDQQSTQQQASASPSAASDFADNSATTTNTAPPPRFRRHDGALDIEV